MPILIELYLQVLMFTFCNIDANFNMMLISVYKTLLMTFFSFQSLYLICDKYCFGVGLFSGSG